MSNGAFSMNKTCRLILFAIGWDIFHFFLLILLKLLEKVIGKTTIRLIVLIVLSAASGINESVNHSSQFISAKVKKTLRKSEAQFREKLRKLMLRQNSDFLIKRRVCIF